MHGVVPNFVSASMGCESAGIRTQVGAIWVADWAMNWQHTTWVARTGREKKSAQKWPDVGARCVADAQSENGNDGND